MKNQESKLQIECVKWFRLRFREPKYLIFAVPNGGVRNKITAKILKAEGVRSGVADLCIMTNCKMFFIEMKFGKGKQTDSQKDFEQVVMNMGFNYYVCNDFDSFQKVCEFELKQRDTDLSRDQNEIDYF